MIGIYRTLIGILENAVIKVVVFVVLLFVGFIGPYSWWCSVQPNGTVSLCLSKDFFGLFTKDENYQLRIYIQNGGPFEKSHGLLKPNGNEFNCPYDEVYEDTVTNSWVYLYNNLKAGEYVVYWENVTGDREYFTFNHNREQTVYSYNESFPKKCIITAKLIDLVDSAQNISFYKCMSTGEPNFSTWNIRNSIVTITHAYTQPNTVVSFPLGKNIESEIKGLLKKCITESISSSNNSQSSLSMIRSGLCYSGNDASYGIIIGKYWYVFPQLLNTELYFIESRLGGF